MQGTIAIEKSPGQLQVVKKIYFYHQHCYCRIIIITATRREVTDVKDNSLTCNKGKVKHFHYIYS